MRRELFGPELWWNASATLLPFVVFFSLAAWIHPAPPSLRPPEERS